MNTQRHLKRFWPYYLNILLALFAFLFSVKQYFECEKKSTLGLGSFISISCSIFFVAIYISTPILISTISYIILRRIYKNTHSVILYIISLFPAVIFIFHEPIWWWLLGILGKVIP